MNEANQALSKHEFVEKMRQRTFLLHLRVIRYCEKVPHSTTTKVVNYQLIKAASSTAANYRAACRARSRKEFIAKMSIVVEEADETIFWLMTYEALAILNIAEVKSLLADFHEVLAICSKARNSAQKQK